MCCDRTRGRTLHRRSSVQCYAKARDSLRSVDPQQWYRPVATKVSHQGPPRGASPVAVPCSPAVRCQARRVNRWYNIAINY